ncbi:hypothetical protein [Beijerinckia sp. L45]|uniref:hypothetical protein n=1 Tax=Beijerinckia sp. L45 TaxID=1641855 RepID=UPI00131E5D0D|nr:hypothetical protein [Beijerinckia sp. L45]
MKRERPLDRDLPTVGDSRRHGLKRLTVECSQLGCPHERAFTFDELALPDEMIFIHVPRYRRFICSRCGGRRVTVRADWRDHNAHGKGQR